MKKRIGWKLICVTLAMGMLVTPVSSSLAAVVGSSDTNNSSTGKAESTAGSTGDTQGDSTQVEETTSTSVADVQSSTSEVMDSTVTSETATIESSTIESSEPAPEVEIMKAEAEITKPKLEFKVQNQNGGWINENAVGEAGVAGGKLRGLKASISDDAGKLLVGSAISLQGSYSHLGWGNGKYVDGDIGLSNSKENLEAIRIKLNSKLQEKFSIYYRVYSTKTGWMGWTKDGATAGTIGLANPVEKLQIVLADKNSKDLSKEPKALIQQNKAPTVSYKTQMRGIGWQKGESQNGAVSGTMGQSRRIETLKAKVSATGLTGSIEYKTHVRLNGWTAFSKDNQASGTVGKALQLEAFQVRLTGELAMFYDVYYQGHAMRFGWLDWASNGTTAGTTGYSYQLEALRIKLVPKGGQAPGATGKPNRTFQQPSVNYQTHIQTYGWSQGIKSNGALAGTSGQGKRLEAVKISLGNTVLSGGIKYQVHGQTYGWQSYRANGQLAGTTGRAKRLEAIKVSLSGEIAKHFDIYYRVHSADLGWLAWTSNNKNAGSSGMGKQIEAIQIKIVKRGHKGPSTQGAAYVTHKVYSIENISQYVRINSNFAGVRTQPDNFSALKNQFKRYGGHMVRATRKANTSSGVFYYVVAPGGDLGWIRANQSTSVQHNFWLQTTDGPYPSLNVANLNIGVSESKQRVYIRSGNKTIYTMICSTGLDKYPGSLSSPLGNFRIQAERGEWFWSAGSGGAFYRSYYLHGVYLFHTVPIAYPGTTTAYNPIEGAKLGQRASHGCIRLSVPDAKWFYYNMPYNTPVNIYR